MNNGRYAIKFKTLMVCLFSLLSLLFFTHTALAAGSNFKLPTIMDKYEVYDGGSAYSPTSNKYPFNTRNTNAIGFDELYGVTKPFFKYKGEISKEASNDEKLGMYRVFDGFEIDGRDRPWSHTKLSEDDVKPSNRDPHIYAMTVSTKSFTLGSIFLSVISGLNWLFSQLVNLVITFKGFNIGTILNAIDSSGSLSKQLSTIFLINPDTGAYSPFLLLGLVAFLIGFISLSIKIMKGKASLRNLVSEFGFFMIAILIAASFFNSSNANTLSKVGIDFMTALSNEISISSSDSTSIFKYSTGNPYMDNISTQKGLISKTYIDQLINAQFGYSVDALYLVKPNGDDGSFGTKQEIQQAMKMTFGDGGSIDSLSVATNLSGTNKINNLGYYLWAANSNVGIYDGTNQTNPAFYSSGDSIVVRNGSSDRALYLVDFLANLRKIHVDHGNDALVNKIDKIANRLSSPDYFAAISNIFVVSLQNICLAYALICISIFTIIGQLIISLGSFCMVVMPVLLLFKATRDTAQRMVYSYLFGFLRYLVGSALFNSIIVISTLLSQQSLMGIVISAVICFLMGRFGPNLIQQINMHLTQLGRGKELRGISTIYHKMDRGFDKWSYKNRKRLDANAYTLDYDGNMVKNGKAVNDYDKNGVGLDKNTNIEREMNSSYKNQGDSGKNQGIVIDNAKNDYENIDKSNNQGSKFDGKNEKADEPYDGVDSIDSNMEESKNENFETERNRSLLNKDIDSGSSNSRKMYGLNEVVQMEKSNESDGTSAKNESSNKNSLNDGNYGDFKIEEPERKNRRSLLDYGSMDSNEGVSVDNSGMNFNADNNNNNNNKSKINRVSKINESEVSNININNESNDKSKGNYVDSIGKPLNSGINSGNIGNSNINRVDGMDANSINESANNVDNSAINVNYIDKNENINESKNLENQVKRKIKIDHGAKSNTDKTINSSSDNINVESKINSSSKSNMEKVNRNTINSANAVDAKSNQMENLVNKNSVKIANVDNIANNMDGKDVENVKQNSNIASKVKVNLINRGLKSANRMPAIGPSINKFMADKASKNIKSKMESGKEGQ